MLHVNLRWHAHCIRETRMSRAGSTDDRSERTPNECVCEPTAHVRRFAHAVRNPLNGARLHLVFLERELARLGASADAIESARVIDDEIDRIAQLVRELVEAPVEQPARSRVSLQALCARAIEMLSIDAREAGVAVGTELCDGDVMLDVQRDEMVQVLSELLHRALSSALGGGGRVLLRARRDVEAAQALIEIQHDGSSDAGLGDFSVAMRIVAEHGGSIDVETAPGQATFFVKLPISGAERNQQRGTSCNQ